MKTIHFSIDCKQEDCPYYGHYDGHSDDDFYRNHGLSAIDIFSDKSRKKEVDDIVRSTCHMCKYNPQERLDMKAWVLRQDAKRLLLHDSM